MAHTQTNTAYHGIHPTTDEKREWARMAQAAYRAGRNDIGHRYSVAASRPHDYAMSCAHFDLLQAGYRAWLVRNVFPSLA